MPIREPKPRLRAELIHSLLPLLLPAERLPRAPLLALLRDHELMNQPVGGMSGLGRRM